MLQPVLKGGGGVVDLLEEGNLFSEGIFFAV